MAVNRREFLQVGYSGLLGMGLPGLLAGRAHAAGPGKAKSVILVFLTGGMSHLDTLDPKPEAPDGIRGDFKPVATRTPGVFVGEGLPMLAGRADRWSVVRSMSHKEGGHLPATHKVLTGNIMSSAPDGSGQDKVATRDDYPCYASTLEYLRPRADGIPNGVTLPTFLIEGPLTWPGQNGGFLGSRFDPWQVRKDPSKPDFREEGLSLAPGLSMDRLKGRQRLIHDAAPPPAGDAYSAQHEIAYSMLTAGKVARAFDLNREDPRLRDRYGRHLFGQSLLLARRLVQAGVPIVQANMGIVQTWDTHVANTNRLKDDLLPPLDRAVSTLLDDLGALGMLDETLVVMTGEFGRTPKISMLPGATVVGRDHWSRAYSAMFAGGGVRGGQAIGRTDKTGASPGSRAYSPNDLGATIYDALGVDPEAEVADRLGRPRKVVTGRRIDPLFTGESSA